MTVSHLRATMVSALMGLILLYVCVILDTKGFSARLKSMSVLVTLVSMVVYVKIWSMVINAAVELEPQGLIVNTTSTNAQVTLVGMEQHVWMASTHIPVNVFRDILVNLIFLVMLLYSFWLYLNFK